MKRYRKDVCTIYVIRNVINGKCYVGQTWTTATCRLREHLYAALSYTKPACVKLARAIVKYGKTSFVVDVLATATSQEEADTLEDRFIVDLNTIVAGYNIRRGGSHGVHSAESRQKMSAAKKGQVITADTRDKLSKALIGRKKGPVSEETKKRQRFAQLGKTHSIEVRRQMSSAHAGKVLSETHRARISQGKKIFWGTLSLEDRRELTSHGVAAIASMSSEQLKARGIKILEARRRNRVMNPKPEDLKVIMRAAELRASNASMSLREIGRTLAQEGHLSKNNTVLKSNSVNGLLSRARDITQALSLKTV